MARDHTPHRDHVPDSEPPEGESLDHLFDDEPVLTPDTVAAQIASLKAIHFPDGPSDDDLADMEDGDFDEFLDVGESDDPLMQYRAVDIEEKKATRRRKQLRGLSPHPHVWVGADRMSQTETSLRVAFYLIRERHVTSDVLVAVRGWALTHGRQPKFPAVAYLAEHGWLPEAGGDGWRAIYRKAGEPHGIRLSDDRRTWHVEAEVAPGARILLFTATGTLSETRSPAVYGPIWNLVGRAVGRRDVGPLDLVAIAVPRSERSRRAAATLRDAPLVRRAALSICTVDRTGGVRGLPFPGLDSL